MSTVLIAKVIDELTIVNSMDTLRLYIEKRRKQLKLSRNKLAERAGKSGAWLSKFMSQDRKEMKLDSFLDLANALNVNPLKLIIAYQGGDPDKESLADESFDNQKKFLQFLVERYDVETLEEVLSLLINSKKNEKKSND